MQATKWNLDDIGIDHSQYMPGYGTAFSEYTDCALGAGSDPREALDDCLEQMAAQGVNNVADIEAAILAEYPDFLDDRLIEENSVIEHLRHENPSEWFDDNSEFGGDCCELYYYVGIKWA